jgi:hypothetical protein
MIPVRSPASVASKVTVVLNQYRLRTFMMIYNGFHLARGFATL